MRSKPVRWLIYLALSIVLAPIILFNSGFLLVGDYAGDRGFLGFLTTIYGAAMAGTFSAWFVLLAPFALLLIWAVVRWSWQTLPAPVETAPGS